jgi:hypothetical protein
MTPGATRTASWRIRSADARAAGWLEAPELTDAVLAAIRSPQLLVWQSFAAGMREVATVYRAWARRGLMLPPSADQLAQGLDALIVPGAGAAAAAAMPAVPQRGTTYALWGLIVRAGATVAGRVGAWAAEWLAQQAGRRPGRRRRLPLPQSPTPVTDSESSSSAPAVDTVDRPSRAPWHPPSERPPGRPTSLGDLLPGLFPEFTDPTRR